MIQPSEEWPSTAPISRRLEPGAVHVWRIPLSPAATDREAALLSADETRRADRFHFARHRNRFIVSHASLRRILAAYLNAEPGELRFDHGPQGKPALEGTAGKLRFNLTHSHELALCAVTRDREVGVDVEWTGRTVDIDSVAGRFFTEREVGEFRELPEGVRRVVFFRIWTRKEAYLKATGEGLSRSSRSFEVTVRPADAPRLLEVVGSPNEAGRWTLEDLDPLPGYSGSVLAGGGWSLRRFSMER